MGSASNVSAGKPNVGGAVYIGALTATLPDDTADALTDFSDLGYCSEDGLVNTNERSNTTIKAWGGDEVLDIQDGKTDTFKVTLIEAKNVDVLKAYYGDDNVSGTLATGITIEANSDELPEKAWVFDMIMRDGALHRIVLPRAKVITTDEITYSDSAAIGFGLTIKAYPDSNGNTHYEYIKAAS